MTTETDVTSDLLRKIRGWIEVETPSHDQAAVASLMRLGHALNEASRCRSKHVRAPCRRVTCVRR
jgi:hypothetical protein